MENLKLFTLFGSPRDLIQRNIASLEAFNNRKDVLNGFYKQKRQNEKINNYSIIFGKKESCKNNSERLLRPKYSRDMNFRPQKDSHKKTSE